MKETYKMPLLVLLLLSVICFLVFKDYLFFDKLYLFKGMAGDTVNYNYPVLVNIAGNHGFPGWTFNAGMGQSMFPFILRDPFDIFLYACSKDAIAYGLIYKEVAKIILTGVIFFAYLRSLRLSDYTSLIGTLLFSFCGFMITGGCWYIFSFEALNLALLLLAFERLFQKNNWYLFPVPVFLFAISQPFNLYVYGLFLFLYAIFRMVQTDTFSVKKLTSLVLKMIGLSLIGLLLSTPFLLENIVRLLDSPRGSGEVSSAHKFLTTPVLSVSDSSQLATGILRFFSSDLAGDARHFAAWKNYLEAPLFYCGLLCLLLLPQVFTLLEKRLKVLFIVFISFWLLPFIFPFFRYSFWLYTGNYYRAYSFFVALVFIYYTVLALELMIQKRKVNLPVLAATAVVVIFLLLYGIHTIHTADHSVLKFVCAILGIYCVLLLLVNTKIPGNYIKLLFLVAIVTELTYLSGNAVNNMEAMETKSWKERIWYNDHTIDAVKYLKQADTSFYRIDKTYYSSPDYFFSLNDGMAQDYHPTTSYNPFNSKHYIHYQQLMGTVSKTDESDTRWASGLLTRPVLESENRVKYLLSKSSATPFGKFAFDSLTTCGDVHILRNKFMLPFGYTYSSYIRESAFDLLSNNQKDIVSLAAVVLNNNELPKASALKEFQLKDTIAGSGFDSAAYSRYVQELSEDTMMDVKVTDAAITGVITLHADKMVYLSVPYDNGWHLYVDGAEQHKVLVNAGMTGIMPGKGHHTILMKYQLRYAGMGILFSLAGFLTYAGMLAYGRRRKQYLF